MTRQMLSLTPALGTALCLGLAAWPLHAAGPLTGPLTEPGASGLPPGLVSAELLPATAQPDGTVITALRLELEPGWKTYWRSPGETGVPPVLDWSRVPGVASAVAHWPEPEVIESDGTRTLGYHDELVLPIRLTLTGDGGAAVGTVAVDFGLCQNICVPAHVELSAPAERSGALDPRISEALDRAPRKGTDPVTCTVTRIEDGLRVAASVPVPQASAAAIEVQSDGIWVSEPDLATDNGQVTATADVVGPTGKPFDLDPASVRLTLIGDGGAVEYQGCTPA